jgi:hypothetical protein
MSHHRPLLTSDSNQPLLQRQATSVTNDEYSPLWQVDHPLPQLPFSMANEITFGPCQNDCDVCGTVMTSLAFATLRPHRHRANPSYYRQSPSEWLSHWQLEANVLEGGQAPLVSDHPCSSIDTRLLTTSAKTRLLLYRLSPMCRCSQTAAAART